MMDKGDLDRRFSASCNYDIRLIVSPSIEIDLVNASLL